MDDLTVLTRRLGALEPPAMERTREQAIRNVATRLRQISASTKRHRHTRRSPQFAAILASISIAVASLSAFTAPGQAITSWVGTQLGFGQPGGHPSLRKLRAAWTRGTSAEGQPAYILAVGPVPGGGRYEFITYWPHETKGGRHGGRWNLGEPCFEVILTQARSTQGGDCGVFPEGPDLYLAGGGNSMGGQESFVLSGRMSKRVRALEARVNDRAVDIEKVSIPQEFIDRFHLGQPFSFFIAFVHPFPRHGGTLSVTARDAMGKVLARTRSDIPNFALAQRFACEQAHRIFREGHERRQAALKNIRGNCPHPWMGRR